MTDINRHPFKTWNLCFSKIHWIISIVFFYLFQKGPETIYQPAHWLRAKMFLTLGPILTKSHHQIKSKILLNFEKSLKKNVKIQSKIRKKFHHYHHIILSMCYLHEAFFIQMLIKNWYLLMPQLKKKYLPNEKKFGPPPLMPPPYLGDPLKYPPTINPKTYISHCNTDAWVCDMNMNSNFLYLLKNKNKFDVIFKFQLHYYIIIL